MFTHSKDCNQKGFFGVHNHMKKIIEKLIKFYFCLKTSPSMLLKPIFYLIFLNRMIHIPIYQVTGPIFVKCSIF